ncbi:glycosyltransferase [Candidatus Enterococcus lemimoniae]|nr:glycosyltransferase [Enterococcus sp. 12C11_DIV0727]
MQTIAVSVLMSIYIKEKPEYFIQAMESTIVQTAQPEEILLVKDGPLTDELDGIIQTYQEKLGNQLTVISLEKNQGLGIALAIGVEKCRNSLIARMDTDDIMVKKRLEIQYQEFLKNNDLTILGSNIIEFEGTPDNELARKSMPESDEQVRKFSTRRNPFNHMTVMFKKQAVIEAGNYLPLPGFEDYYLWVRLLKRGNQGQNLPEYLVYARTGLDMYNRRGGLKYLLPGIEARRKIYQDGLGSLGDFLTVSVFHTVICIMPNKLRGLIYKRMLRK